MKKIILSLLIVGLALCGNSTNTSTSMTDFVNGVTESWKNITDAFKTSIKNEIIANISDNGFSKFESSGSTIVKMGLPRSAYGRFVDGIARLVGVPSDKKEEFKFLLSMGDLGGKTAWNNHQLVFNVDENSSCKYVNLFINDDKENADLVNFIIVQIKATFKFAPNILVMEKSRSILGGIYEDNDIKFVEKPKNLKIEDTKALFDFFKMLSMITVADSLDINIPS